MRKLLLLTAGGAVGYVLGAKAGTQRYETLKAKAVSAREHSPELVQKVRELRSKGEAVVEDISTDRPQKSALDMTSGSTTSATRNAS